MTDKTSTLDKIDRQIIDLLRTDARMSYRELGERVFLSANTVAERVRRLVESRVLLGFHAQVDLAALDLSLQALMEVKLSPDTPAAHFERAIGQIAGVMSAWLTTGSCDYTLHVACRDQADLVRVIETLRSQAGVQDTISRVILRRIPSG
jgi:Lrp/AsnC family leucine-responsive transcriptional regulator